MTIYFIQAGELGPVKIGHGTNPRRRLHNLQIGSAEPLRLLGIREGDEEEERHLHQRFAHLHIRGEWFTFSPEMLDGLSVVHFRRKTLNCKTHDPMKNSATRIIERFGGTRALARAIDKPASTVQSWKDSGRIPAQHQGTVLAAARLAAIGLAPEDFFEASEPQPPEAA